MNTEKIVKEATCNIKKYAYGQNEYSAVAKKVESYKNGILNEFLIEFRDSVRKELEKLDRVNFSSMTDKIEKKGKYFYITFFNKLYKGHKINDKIILVFDCKEDEYDVFLTIDNEELYVSQSSNSKNIANEIIRYYKEQDF